MLPTAIMIEVVVIAAVFVIPMSFVHLPATLVVVIVRMSPVSARIRWPLPYARIPDITPIIVAPVSVDPGVALAWHGRSDFIADGWWRSADVNMDLAKCRHCQGRRGEDTTT
jgi:hypothetical protein